MTVALSTHVVHETGMQQRTAGEIRAQVNLIQEVLQAVMLKDVHFGVIPGTGGKPSLYKAGAEKILSTFHIGLEPIVEDLSTPDEARYRVRARAFHTHTGMELGSGIGEASSHETKYMWRSAVCQEEFDGTPEDRRRGLWKKGEGGAYQIKQVRTHPADVANTILKMAKKRAMIDMTLTVTAASDVFQQDIEDLPAEILHDIVGDGGPAAAPAKAPIQPPQRKSAPAEAPAAASGAGPIGIINEMQARRMFAKAMGAGWTKDDYRQALKSKYGVDSDKNLPVAHYTDAVAYFEAVQQQ